jgi:Na+-driven multidrug efflux pump
MADSMGAFFVDDKAIQLEIARILPIVSLSLFLFGIVMIISTYFQAIGDMTRAAITGLGRTWLFAIPLMICMPFIFGESGIWWSGVIADICAGLLCWFIYARRPGRDSIAIVNSIHN